MHLKQLGTSQSTSTIAGYYGLNNNIFFGNVGRSLNTVFLPKSELYFIESLDNYGDPAKISDLVEKKLQKRKHHDTCNQEYFMRKKQIILAKYDQMQTLLSPEKRETALQILFQEMNNELQKLQERYEIQRNIIARSHTINMHGKYEKMCFDDMDDGKINLLQEIEINLFDESLDVVELISSSSSPASCSSTSPSSF
jgi:hypothetical protein